MKVIWWRAVINEGPPADAQHRLFVDNGLETGFVSRSLLEADPEEDQVQRTTTWFVDNERLGAPG